MKNLELRMKNWGGSALEGGRLDGVVGRVNGVAGRDNGVAGRDNGVAGLDNGVAGRDNGVAGLDNGVAGRDNGVAGRDNGVAGRVNGTKVRVFGPSTRPNQTAIVPTLSPNSLFSSTCSIIPNSPIAPFFLLTISLFAFLPLLSIAQSPIKTWLDSNQVMLGDQVKLNMEISLPKGTVCQFPTPKDSITSSIEVVGIKGPDTTLTPDGGWVLRQSIVITSFDTGFLVIPPMPLVVGTDTLLTDAQLIYFADMPVNMEEDIKDIHEPLEPPFDWHSLIPYGIGGLVLLVLLIVAYMLWKRWKNRPEPLALPESIEPPYITALARFEALRQQKLWQADRFKEYHIELTEILRWYLDQRFGLSSIEQTTDETIGSMERAGIDRVLVADVRKVLVLADLVKFAKARPISTENEQSMDLCIGFVKATIPAIDSIKEVKE